LLADDARARARAADSALAAGAPLGPLHGLPIAIKDLAHFKAGVPNTFGCKPFADWVPPRSALSVERLERAGAIVLGKTNVPELGFRGTTDNLLFGPTSTPFAIGRNAGGSSGGSAAATAAGLAAVALGDDGGGSVRIPAAWCGTYGFKPSFGRVASIVRPDGYALGVPFACPAGPISRTVADAALMMDAIAGPDPRDPLCLAAEDVDYLAVARADAPPLRIAWTPDFGVFPVDPEVARIAREAVQAFADAGAEVEQVRIELRRSQHELYDAWERQCAVRLAADAGAFRAEGIDLLAAAPGEISRELAGVLELGRAQRAIAYRADDVIRTEVFDALEAVFADFDVIASPTLAVLPVENARDGNTVGPATVNGTPVNPLLGWCLTYLYNFTGHPAASIPAGLSADGLPVGLQLAGRRGADASVIAASAAFERVRPWAHVYPTLLGV
jgi:Asp-tRNA(Asn)/Glu-tRNA(Gln) amidotransferase A subunit family amidase